MSTFENLDKKFEVEKTQTMNIVTQKSFKDDDIEKARDTLHNLIDKGQDAIDGILSIAKNSDHPRAYEVVGQLIKTVSDVTRELVDTQKKKHDIERKDQAKIGVQNNMFVGSTQDLMKMLKNPPEQILEIKSDD